MFAAVGSIGRRSGLSPRRRPISALRGLRSRRATGNGRAAARRDSRALAKDMSARSRCSTNFAPAEGRCGGGGAAGRIVRLDPNNLPATQALALSLFNRGALDEAEYHARNAVRIAPTGRAVAQSDGHDHDRGAAPPSRRAPLPPRDGADGVSEPDPRRQPGLEPEEPRAYRRVATALRRVRSARSDNLPDPLRLGADGGDRPQFRAGG